MRAEGPVVLECKLPPKAPGDRLRTRGDIGELLRVLDLSPPRRPNRLPPNGPGELPLPGKLPPRGFVIEDRTDRRPLRVAGAVLSAAVDNDPGESIGDDDSLVKLFFFLMMAGDGGKGPLVFCVTFRNVLFVLGNSVGFNGTRHSPKSNSPHSKLS